MHVESVEKSKSRSLVLLIITIVSCFVVITISNYLQSIGYVKVSIFTYIFLVLAAFYLIKTELTGYRYTFEDATIYFERTSGKRCALVAGIETSKISYFGEYDKGLEKANKWVLTNRGTKDSHCIDFTLDSKKGLQRIIFHPSELLAGMLNESMTKKEQANDR